MGVAPLYILWLNPNIGMYLAVTGMLLIYLGVFTHRNTHT